MTEQLPQKMKFFLCESHHDEELADFIQAVHGCPITERVMIINNARMKMEKMIEDKVGDTKILLMDFCKHRRAGPGRASLDAETTGFNLDENEEFGEMTAVLYAPETRYIVIQYNHHGARFNSIAKYFNDLSLGKVSPEINNLFFRIAAPDHIIEKMHKMSHNAYFEFACIPQKLTQTEREELGIVGAINNIESLANDIGLVKISVHKKPGKGKRITELRVFLDKIMNSIMKDDKEYVIKDEDKRAITRAKLRGAETHDDETTELDLLSAKLSVEYDAPAINPDTRMYNFSDRCILLKNAYKELFQLKTNSKQ